MLEYLEINNFILIEKISLDFTNGFNVITGETGSGKSMILSALHFLLSGKNSDKLQKDKDKDTTVIAVFSSPSAQILEFLELHGIDANEEIVLKRQFKAHSRLSSYIQDNYCSSSVFEELAALLINLNTQRDENKLLQPQFATKFLDAYLSLTPLALSLRKLKSEHRELDEKLKKINEDYNQSLRERDYLEYAKNEIEKAKPQVGEDEDLKDKLKAIKNKEFLRTQLQNLISVFQSNSDTLNALHSSKQSAAHIKDINPEFSEIDEKINNLYFDACDIKDTLGQFKNKIDFDDYDEEKITDRLDILSQLKRKYGSSIEALIEFKDQCAAKLEKMGTFDIEHNRIKKHLEDLETQIKDKKEELYKKRLNGIDELNKKVTQSLGELSMPHSLFLVSIEQNKEILHDDNIVFLIKTNPSSPPMPLAKIASGGEMSRVFLSLLSLDKQNEQSLEVFDEIDAGVGGQVAKSVGKYISQIAQKGQIIAITHQANIAALAKNHIVVQKKNTNNATDVRAFGVSGKERIEEVARMLAGEKDDIALTHAALLLNAKN